MIQRFSAGSFVVGVMFGALLAGAWFFSDAGGLPLTADPAPFIPASDEALAPESGAVSVLDQPPGETVIVESVTVPPPGVWVAVREMNGRDLGNVLGAARVTGPRRPVVVALLRATEPNRSYAIELYRDDNGDAFDPAVNSVYVDFDTGARVVAYFATAE